MNNYIEYAIIVACVLVLAKLVVSRYKTKDKKSEIESLPNKTILECVFYHPKQDKLYILTEVGHPLDDDYFVFLEHENLRSHLDVGADGMDILQELEYIGKF